MPTRSLAWRALRWMNWAGPWLIGRGRKSGWDPEGSTCAVKIKSPMRGPGILFLAVLLFVVWLIRGGHHHHPPAGAPAAEVDRKRNTAGPVFLAHVFLAIKMHLTIAAASTTVLKEEIKLLGRRAPLLPPPSFFLLLCPAIVSVATLAAVTTSGRLVRVLCISSLFKWKRQLFIQFLILAPGGHLAATAGTICCFNKEINRCCVVSNPSHDSTLVEPNKKGNKKKQRITFCWVVVAFFFSSSSSFCGRWWSVGRPLGCLKTAQSA